MNIKIFTNKLLNIEISTHCFTSHLRYTSGLIPCFRTTLGKANWSQRQLISRSSILTSACSELTLWGFIQLLLTTITASFYFKKKLDSSSGKYYYGRESQWVCMLETALSHAHFFTKAMKFFVQKRSIDIININDLQPRSFIYCICNDTDEM